LLDRCVAEDELDLQPERRGEPLDRILGPAALLGAEEAGAAGDRRERGSVIVFLQLKPASDVTATL